VKVEISEDSGRRESFWGGGGKGGVEGVGFQGWLRGFRGGISCSIVITTKSSTQRKEKLKRP